MFGSIQIPLTLAVVLIFMAASCSKGPLNTKPGAGTTQPTSGSDISEVTAPSLPIASPSPVASPVPSPTPVVSPSPVPSVQPSPSPSPSPTTSSPMDALLNFLIPSAQASGYCSAKIICSTEAMNFATGSSIPANSGKACSDPAAFMTSCFVGTYPSGQQFCGSSILVTIDGRSICQVSPCSGVPNNYWSISSTCCKAVYLPCN